MTSSPLDIAIYFFICRQFLFTKKAVPFGREDARLLDPELSGGGYDRAIKRLVAKGALKRVDVSGSLKNCFTPAWVTPTHTVPWGTSAATRFDRPQGCTYTPIERHLIDLYLGSYTPKVSGRSEVMRYTKGPLLSLCDVGVYIINRHHARKGLPVYIPRPYRSTYDLSRLVRAGLCDDQGHFFPVPSLQAVLTAVSQCAFGLDTDAPQLTPIGWSALGITQNHALSEPLSPLEMARLSTAGVAPLFFAPPGMIDFDSMVGSKARIDSPHVEGGQNSPSESHEKSGRALTDQPTWKHDSMNPHEQTNPPAAHAAIAGTEVPVEIYRLYSQLNRKRAIPATDWESLTLMAEISGGWANIRSILIAAAARRAGPPTILTPRYIASSLAEQAASDSDAPDIGDIEEAPATSPAPSADDELWRLLTGMSQRAKLIREGKATLERVQGWVAVMDLMEQHGMQFSSRPGWLYHQLDAGNEPWASEQAIKVAKKDKARRDDEERQAAQRERERQEEEQRQQEADQTRKSDLLLYDAWRVSMRAHPENEQVVISALQRLYGVQSVQFDDEQIVLVVETTPSSSDLKRLYTGAHYLLGLTSIVEIEVRPSARPSATPATCAHPCERPAPRPVPMPTGTGDQAKPTEASLEPPSWIILPERWDTLPKTLRLLLVGAHYDAVTNTLVVPTAFHARKVNEQWTSWAEVCPADVRVLSRDEVTKEVSETVSSSGYNQPEGTLAQAMGSHPATVASEDTSTKDQSSPNHVLTAQDATTALNDIIMYNRELSHLTGKLQVTEWEPPKGIVTVQVDGLEAFLRVQQERSWFCRELAALAGAGQPAIPVTFQNVDH